MNSLIMKKTRKYIKEHHLKEITFDSLKVAAAEDGYTVIEFNNSYNDENVRTIIENLKIEDVIVRSRGFTYTDRNYRLIFINEDLSENEKILVLSHELGHIACNHVDCQSVIGKDVVEEHEANEFSHYLLKKNTLQKVRITAAEHKKAAAAIFVLIMLCLISIPGFYVMKNEQTYAKGLYVTPTGSKYHKKECIFVKYKKSAKKLTKEAFESGKYEACDICLP